MGADLEDRIRNVGDAATPSEAATRRARDAALNALARPRARRRAWLPRRRMVSAAMAVAGTLAIAAVLVFSLPRGADVPAPGGGITLVADAGTAAVTDAQLRDTARMIERRARIMDVDGVRADVVDGDIVLRIPGDAEPGLLTALTARGEFAMYDWAAQVVDNGDGGALTPPAAGPGETVIRVPDPVSPTGTTRYYLVRGAPALTNVDIAEVSLLDDPATTTPRPFLAATLTPGGERAFHELTRTVAQRGAVQQELFTFAMVLDGVLVSNPVIDPQDFPDGISGGAFQIDAGPGVPLATRRAQAAQIEEGPLPVALTPAG